MHMPTTTLCGEQGRVFAFYLVHVQTPAVHQNNFSASLPVLAQEFLAQVSRSPQRLELPVSPDFRVTSFLISSVLRGVQGKSSIFSLVSFSLLWVDTGMLTFGLFKHWHSGRSL